MPGHLWRFAGCEFDDQRRTLRVDGVLVDMESKPLDVLQQLLLRAGQVVTKVELLDTVWPGLVVVDGSLATAISKLRRALGAHAGLIVTLPRVGYRLGGLVERLPSPDSLVTVGDSPATAAPPPAPVAAASPRRWLWVAGVAALLAVAAVLFTWKSAASPGLPAVAVLPLQNLGADPDQDYLRLGLADEVATLLSRARGITVRPFATTRQYAVPPADLRSYGRQLGVDSLLTGHFQQARGRLAVTLEAIDVRSGRLLWRDSMDAPASSMVSMQVQLALRIREGLVPALGGSVSTPVAAPASEQAYLLFLRSTAMATDAEANREGIALLQAAVAIDAGYAPAWHALSKRFYIDARYGGGDMARLHEGQAAAKRADALDPDNVAASAALVIYEVERGALDDALRRALGLVARRPDSMDARFALSYVLRFQGKLQEAAIQCDRAYQLDSRNHTSGLRSCAVVFLLRQDYVRTAMYLRLDEGSDFERALALHARIAQGNTTVSDLPEADIPEWGGFRLLHACAARQPAQRIAVLVAGVQPSDDAETNYFAAAHLAYCGEIERARALLARAIAAGYCSYPAMLTDPLLAQLRVAPGFAALETAGAACAGRSAAAAGT